MPGAVPGIITTTGTKTKTIDIGNDDGASVSLVVVSGREVAPAAPHLSSSLKMSRSDCGLGMLVSYQ